MDEIIIREALPEDAEALLAFTKLVGGESDNLSFGPEGLPISVEQERAYLEMVHGEERSVFFGAWKGERLVGTGSLSSLPRRMRHRAELAVSVAKGEWGCGIGSRLLEALIGYAKTHEIALLNLEVRRDNIRAIGLYEKYGFQRIGISPAFFRIGEEDIDFILMYLDLR